MIDIINNVNFRSHTIGPISESWMNVIAKFGLEYEPNKLTPKVLDLIDLQTYVCDHMCSLMAWTKLSLKKYLRN